MSAGLRDLVGDSSTDLLWVGSSVSLARTQVALTGKQCVKVRKIAGKRPQLTSCSESTKSLYVWSRMASQMSRVQLESLLACQVISITARLDALAHF